MQRLEEKLAEASRHFEESHLQHEKEIRNHEKLDWEQVNQVFENGRRAFVM